MIFIDSVILNAIERACRLFGAGYANVQPYSGSQASAVQPPSRNCA